MNGWRHSSGTRTKERLRDQFGAVIQDIEHTFLNLPECELESLFLNYGASYGKSAESYARKTYDAWKTGKTKLNGITAERLLDILPYHLTFNERYDLLKKLRTKYVKKTSEHISVSPENWKVEVHNSINNIIAISREYSFPEVLYKRATWLANGDVAAAQRLLHAADVDEARLRAAYLDAEFKRIDMFVSHMKDTQSVSHRIIIPQGEIYVTINIPKQSIWKKTFGKSRGKTMTEDKNEIIRKENLEKPIVIPASNNSLLNIVAGELSQEERTALRTKVINVKLELDISQHKADQRFLDSTRDMTNTVRAVNSLEQASRSDYEVRSRFETASGCTDIHVKKNNNTVIIVVAIVIGFIIFLLVK